MAVEPCAVRLDVVARRAAGLPAASRATSEGSLAGAQHTHAARHWAEILRDDDARYARHEAGRCRRACAAQLPLRVDRGETRFHSYVARTVRSIHRSRVARATSVAGDHAARRRGLPLGEGALQLPRRGWPLRASW